MGLHNHLQPCIHNFCGVITQWICGSNNVLDEDDKNNNYNDSDDGDISKMNQTLSNNSKQFGQGVTEQDNEENEAEIALLNAEKNMNDENLFAEINNVWHLQV